MRTLQKKLQKVQSHKRHGNAKKLKKHSKCSLMTAQMITTNASSSLPYFKNADYVAAVLSPECAQS